VRQNTDTCGGFLLIGVVRLCSNFLVLVIPWGRFAPLRSDLSQAAKPEEAGGNGTAQRFWEWNEEQVKAYL